MSYRGRVRKAFDKRTIQASFTGHLTGLPQDILALFQPGPDIKYLPPIMKNSKSTCIKGIASLVGIFDLKSSSDHLKPFCKVFTNNEYQHQVRLSESAYKKKIIVNQKNDKFDPMSDPNIDGNPFKTLFISGLSYNITERRLWREFEEFGPISRVRHVTDKLNGNPRGYGFIEFERLEDMKRAYKMGMNRNLEGRRIIVDVERGRTVADWKPRRFGGGLGGETRTTKPKNFVNKVVSNVSSSDPSCSYKKCISQTYSTSACLYNEKRCQQYTQKSSIHRSSRKVLSREKNKSSRKKSSSLHNRRYKSKKYDSKKKKTKKK
jgi:U1 small nuclear ribonucleoprotein